MLFSMGVVGKLFEKSNLRLIVGAGFCVIAYFMHMLTGFNLFVDYGTVAWTRFVMDPIQRCRVSDFST